MPPPGGCRAIRGKGMPIERVAYLILILALTQGIAAPARSDLAWPPLCARIDAPADRAPDEVRRYAMRLNDQPAGREEFRFWREQDRIHVAVRTELEADILVFPADFRHCRFERWREEAGVPQLVELEGATNYAVPFKADNEVRIERDLERGDIMYRGTSSLGSFEERHPENTGTISPWSMRTIDYDRLLNVFQHGAYQIENRLVGRAIVDDGEIAHYAMAGEWPRHLWYDDQGMMIRFCAEEAFDTYIETVLEAYRERDTDAVELNRPCAELFQ
jgi:Family of unknown function (DUF6134)